MVKGAVSVLPVCAAAITLFGTVAVPPAHADDSGAALFNGINQLRPCAPLSADPRLTAAAQRHAEDMLDHGVDGHTGSDGSSPQARVRDAGYTQIERSGEIVFWGTGALATPATALDMWMQSPGHHDIIVNCAFTAGGFATASDGNKMTAVVDFATP
jgi:uncharacterized protein YkwD